MTHAVFRGRTLATAAVALAMTSGQALAQSDDSIAGQALGLGKSAFSGFTGTASAGASFTSGNAESNNINASLRLIKSTERWDHVVTSEYFKGTSTVLVTQRDDDGNVVVDDNGFPVRNIVEGDNSDLFSIGYQPKYYINEKLYAFGILDYLTDEPANIDSSTRQIIGVGYSFYRNATGNLSGEIGFGNKTLDPVNGENLDGGIGYLGLNYLNRITDTVTLNADLQADFGSDNTFVELGLGAKFALSDRFSLSITHFSRSNTDLEDPGNPLSSDTDNITTFNLVLDI